MRQPHATPQSKGEKINTKPEQQQNSQPSPSPEEQRAKEKAANNQKVINACGIAGVATFIILNFTTGVVPGGFVGGAAGAGLGTIVGFIINSLRAK